MEETYNNELSELSKPFNFRKYLHNFKTTEKEDRTSSKSMLNKFRPKKSKTLNSQHKVCPRVPSRKPEIKMTTQSTKTGICFICNHEFLHTELSAHEKLCLDNIQNTDVPYTRQNTDGGSSTSSNSFTPMLDTSNLSTHSSGSSNDSYEKKHTRCYICGTDVPNYLKNIHEKNCKKSWESGLLNSISTPARRTNSRGDLISTKSSSLTRGTSVTEISKKNSKLLKSKSTTNLWNSPKKETKKSTPRKSLDSSYSRSTMNINKKISNDRSNDQKVCWNRTKSLQDVRSETAKPTEQKKTTGVPKYIECQYCGKQYSEHSIGIHRRQCERTRHLQKNAGTETEYKKKSRSLMDLSGFKRSTPSAIPSRPSTATSHKSERPSTGTPHKSERPSTATPHKSERPKRPPSGTTPLKEKGRSISMGNLHKTSTSPDYTNTNSKVISVDLNEDENQENKRPTSSPGLQKCYLCGQIYGQRSLPIHEKQCLKKWEREKLRDMEEEEERKIQSKRKNREIKLLPFGKVRHDDSTEEAVKEPIKVIPSKLFGVESPLNISKDNTKTNSHENAVNDVSNIQQENKPQHFERNLITRTINKEETNDKITDQENRPMSANKFVLCIFCNKQYGVHSISIHEKSCRERKTTENEVKERLFKGDAKVNKKLSNGLSNITDSNNFLNEDVLLVKCDDCNRKFLSTDIEKHQIHCRVAIL